LFMRIADATTSEALAVLHSCQEGLTADEVQERLEHYGVNEIVHEKYQWQKQLLKAALNPFILLLSVLAIVSYFTDDIKG
ncbi:cation-transporting P-type ATPase, partial [Pseudomonas sp. FW306-02-H05-AA]|uniref:cation-transporting P-type ATPase n=1 Tax=Pseudomonas sp. FW306-02-H05-AA TaxID=2070657 RepID=UPI000CC205A6